MTFLLRLVACYFVDNANRFYDLAKILESYLRIQIALYPAQHADHTFFSGLILLHAAAVSRHKLK